MKIVNGILFHQILIPKILKTNILKQCVHNKDISIVETPIVLYSLKGSRNVNNNNTLTNELKKLKNEYDNGNISENTYKSKVKELKDYTEEANKLPKEISSNTIKKGQKNISHKGSSDEETMPDNIESGLSETEGYTNSDAHLNFLDKISESIENLKEKIVDVIDDIKLEFDIFKDYTVPNTWEQMKENVFNNIEKVKDLTQDILGDTFKSHATEIRRYTLKDIAENPHLMDNLSIEEIKQIDVSMCPELEEFLQTPLDEVPDGLMSNILEDLPEGFGVGDETLYETLKGVVENATDMLG